mgnify:CR=1 FL=1
MELSSIRRCFITYRECNANTNSPTLYSSLHFNQSTRMGVRPALSATATRSARFQSTHPHGVRQKLRAKIKYYCNVSIHAPARGATAMNSSLVVGNVFQSTHPHGVRPAHIICWSTPVSFQSTHPHGVRRLLMLRVGRTCSFNPRTRMGCDFCHFMGCTMTNGFNPRTRMGCDVAQIPVRAVDVVSIHAPAWGATRRKPPKRRPRTFQSTHPHGVRQSKCNTSGHCCRSFNPRTRMGCDVVQLAWAFGDKVSIHAPAWGATLP